MSRAAFDCSVENNVAVLRKKKAGLVLDSESHRSQLAQLTPVWIVDLHSIVDAAIGWDRDCQVFTLTQRIGDRTKTRFLEGEAAKMAWSALLDVLFGKE